MGSQHEVQDASVEDGILRMRVDGVFHEVDLRKTSRRLAKATPAQIACFEVSPSGYGIHWPGVDEDLTVDGLIRNSQAGYPEMW
jgi:hypothetical protein